MRAKTCGRFRLGLAVVILAASMAAAAANDDLRLPPPTFPDAVAHWRAGRISSALARLDETAPATDPQPLEALVLRATLLRDAGRAPEAESLWRAVIGREVWLRTFSRRALVESLAGRGEPAEAEPVLADLTRSDTTRHLDMALRVAAAYSLGGDTERATSHYRQVLGRQRRGISADAARIGLATVLERDGETEAAMALLREAKLQHWRADTFARADANERRLVRAVGRNQKPFSESEYRTLVRRLRNASRHEAALALIEEWREAHPSTSQPDRIAAERIESLYVQRANEDAVAAAAQFYEEFPASALVPSVRLTDFRLAVRMGDTERARQTGLDFWQGRVRDATAADRRSAALLLAAYLVAVGDVDGGLDLYRELFRAAQSADDQRDILWRAGVAALRDGQHERALTNLRGLINRRPSGDLAPAGLYWLGVAEARTDATAAAIRSFGSVAERFPYHYYGIRARKRLADLTNPPGDGGTGRPLDFPTLEVSRASQGRAEYKAAMALARAGLIEDAAWYLRRLLDRQRRDRGLALLTARASAAAGDYAGVSSVLVNHFGAFMRRPTTNLPEDFWTMVYPRPFWDAVTASAKRHDVDPALLVSLMRQESRFDPDARSPVGAIGLLQIMPYTAEALAESAGVAEIVDRDGIDEAALSDPRVNTLIAARLNGNLLEMFDGAIPPVIASYNAGEERVAIWWRAARELRADFFIDTIPYSETRRFVREVLTNYEAYQRIYGDR